MSIILAIAVFASTGLLSILTMSGGDYVDTAKSWIDNAISGLGLTAMEKDPSLDNNHSLRVSPNQAGAISQQEYDVQKHCTSDLSKHPNYIEYLRYFNCGRVSIDDDSRTLREFTIIAEEDQEIPISHEGHVLDAWTFNGTIPGPTIRVTEGDHVKITLINDASSEHAHSIHMHSIHSSEMDGVGRPVAPGQSFTYDFIAQPAGLYPYHCHVDPIADHINRGLYGVLIIDPKTPREQMPEMVMMLNGYDLDYDQEGPFTLPPLDGDSEGNDTEAERDNEIYSVNGMAFGYVDNPIKLQLNQKYRIYAVNMLEFDRVNSFHIHGTLFEYQPSGIPEGKFMNDIVTFSPGDRGVMEFKYDYPGQYMFHAHQAEFADKGWMGFFDVGDAATSNPHSASPSPHQQHGSVSGGTVDDESQTDPAPPEDVNGSDSSAENSTESSAATEPPETQPMEFMVSIVGNVGRNSYDPSLLSLVVNDKVTWVNDDSISHSVTANSGAFESEILSSGEAFSVTFDSEGEFSYHCTVHPNMNGTVVVKNDQHESLT